jgi:hypothetical protein
MFIQLHFKCKRIEYFYSNARNFFAKILSLYLSLAIEVNLSPVQAMKAHTLNLGIRWR